MSDQIKILRDMPEPPLMRDYQTPEIIFEADLQTRAGSPLTGGGLDPLFDDNSGFGNLP
jgi:hypothetical protein